jgi:O-antigen/teichoic acid export membrane protein
MVQGIFAARLLGVEGFGLLSATVIPFVSTVNRLSSFRMSELVVKYMGEYLTAGKTKEAAALVKGAGLTDVLASLISFLILLVLSPVAATYLAKDSTTVNLFLAYGTILLANGFFETATGILQTRDRFQTIAIINFIQSAITASLIFTAFLTQRGLIEVLGAYWLGKVFAGITISIVAFFELRTALGPRWWRVPLRTIPNWRPMSRFALSTNLSGTLNLVTRDSETLWIAFLRSPTEAGYYKIALAVINLVMLPVQPLIGTTYAEITKTIAKLDWKKTKRLLSKVSQLAGVWTIAAAGGLTVLGSWLIQTLYGSEYGPSYPATLILLVGYGFANILFWNRPLLLALGFPTYPLKIVAAVGALKIGLALWLVPQYGYLVEAALLSGFFLLSIGLNVLRGLRVIRFQEQEGLVAV